MCMYAYVFIYAYTHLHTCTHWVSSRGVILSVSPGRCCATTNVGGLTERRAGGGEGTAVSVGGLTPRQGKNSVWLVCWICVGSVHQVVNMA